MSDAIKRLRQRLSPRSVADWRQLTGAVIIGVTLAACATSGSISKDSPDEAKQSAVMKRANERWAAVIGGDVQASYAMLSAGSKATTSYEAYQRKARLKGFRQATVESAACTGDICRVKVQLVLDTVKMKGIQVPETETWILEKGDYWYVFPF